MSRKQDQNRLKNLRHKKAVEDKKKADPASKRFRQKFSEAARKLMDKGDLKELAKLPHDEVWNNSTGRGRRQIMRHEAREKKAKAAALFV